MIGGVFAGRGFQDDFQVADTIADGFELMGVDDRRVPASGTLTVYSFRQKILVLAEKHSFEGGARSSNSGSGMRVVPSCWAMRTSKPLRLKARVMAMGIWTSM